MQLAELMRFSAAISYPPGTEVTAPYMHNLLQSQSLKGHIISQMISLKTQIQSNGREFGSKSGRRRWQAMMWIGSFISMELWHTW